MFLGVTLAHVREATGLTVLMSLVLTLTNVQPATNVNMDVSTLSAVFTAFVLAVTGCLPTTGLAKTLMNVPR
jgi:hypothetical protein